MKRYLLTFLLASLPVIAAAFDEELEPPEVDFSLQVLHSRIDLSPLNGDTINGITVRLGADLKDVQAGSWTWAIEGAINYFGTSDGTTLEVVCDNDCAGNGPPGLSPIPDRVEYFHQEKLRLSGLEFGARLFDGQLFYVRGGGFLYNLKQRNQLKYKYYYSSPTSIDEGVHIPAEETKSGFAPYIGAGLNIPIIEDLKLLLEANVYRIENENLGILNAGLRLNF